MSLSAVVITKWLSSDGKVSERFGVVFTLTSCKYCPHSPRIATLNSLYFQPGSEGKCRRAVGQRCGHFGRFLFRMFQ